MSAPEISVVMSFSNNARHIALAVDSILNQDDVDPEFVFVDDRSTHDAQ